jgi:hypothetical protein
MMPRKSAASSSRRSKNLKKIPHNNENNKTISKLKIEEAFITKVN